MYLSLLREQFRITFGFPEQGSKGDTRLSKNFNLALRMMWAELPEVLRRGEMRVRLVPALTDGLLNVDVDDPLVMVLFGAADLLPDDGTLRGRWIDIERDGHIYTRRVRDVYTLKGPPDHSLIVLDEPWDNVTDVGLSYRLYTLDYALPPEVQNVLHGNRCNTRYPGPGGEEPLMPADLHNLRVTDGWDAAGAPSRWGRGDYTQLPAPHYTPEVSPSPANILHGFDNPWGFSGSFVEHRDTFVGQRYGAAGEFSYRVCHAWGRHPGINPTQEAVLRPFYISSPSPATARITTAWGGAGNVITSPDVDWVYGYGHTETLRSHHHHGTEKWWFRARHGVEDPTAVSNHAFVKLVESDEIYYLWRITEGHEIQAIDVGDYDPVDRRFPLADFQGHFAVRFDRTPESAEEWLFTVLKRAPSLDYDTDAVAFPTDHALLALFQLVASFITGDRDGEPNRKSSYFKQYLYHMNEVRKGYTFNKAVPVAFGNGLSGPRDRRIVYGPIREG